MPYSTSFLELDVARLMLRTHVLPCPTLDRVIDDNTYGDSSVTEIVKYSVIAHIDMGTRFVLVDRPMSI